MFLAVLPSSQPAMSISGHFFSDRLLLLFCAFSLEISELEGKAAGTGQPS